MKEPDIKDFEISIGGQKLDYNTAFEIDQSHYNPALKGKLEMKLLNTEPSNALMQLMSQPTKVSDNMQDCLMVYQTFRWEIMKVQFKRDNPTQQAQELAEKISRDFGFEKCPIRIDRFEVDSDGAIALDVVFLLGESWMA